MMRALLVLGLAAFLAGASAHAQAPAPRVALIIGNAAYPSAPGIATAAADATIVAETMRTAGYDVTELQDLTAANFGQTIRAFLDKVYAAGPEAVAFVYFGGYHTEGGLIERQAADQGLKFTLMMGDAIATPEFWAISGPAGEDIPGRDVALREGDELHLGSHTGRVIEVPGHTRGHSSSHRQNACGPNTRGPAGGKSFRDRQSAQPRRRTNRLSG